MSLKNSDFLTAQYKPKTQVTNKLRFPMPQEALYQILGVGAPIMDQILQVDDDYLNQISGTKGGMIPIDYETLQTIIKKSDKVPLTIAGGSTSNTIKGLASLGHYCALIGKIGNDSLAKRYLENIQALGITPLYVQGSSPMGQVACLISPEGDRTCRSYLGAHQDMKAEDLDPKKFEGVQLVHIEGYTLLNGNLAEKAMEITKAAGAKISFDLASFEIVETYKDTIVHLISKYVDILFCNAEEAKKLTHLSSEQSCHFLKDLCETVIVSEGKNGCWVGHYEKSFHQPAYPAVTLDTTGAGDLFASGFLHGILTSQPLEKCARYGAYLGASVVELLGAEIPKEQWSQISKHLLHL